jgi:YceI-like domain
LSKRVCVVALTLLLTSCGTTPSHRIPTPSPASVESLPSPGMYRIDPARSQLRVMVFRGGSLAHLGHNHVLDNRALSGVVTVGDSLQSSSFEFSAPVGKFVVDDAQARQEEGADFPGEVPDDAKAGTLHNMLSASQLNGAQFPTLDVKSVTIDSVQGVPTATLKVTVAGHDSTISAPFSLTGDSGELRATGQFELRQSAVGISPYSLMGGALQVLDAMQVKLTIVAEP